MCGGQAFQLCQFSDMADSIFQLLCTHLYAARAQIRESLLSRIEPWRRHCCRYGKAVSADGSGGDILFVPQRPYMVLGTLREQLLYPTWPTQAQNE